ncbi:electron transport complex subunit RsxG [Thalassotalea euphylliae]|uniref:Ion-translocating oxidoreductase complex subunit G n=1 Tax=Thalassotalea euphylliae TaxID=1655234 RepID=A0A3E0UGF3_9GAMM|nr:electron transport complex subunit RsxG [Thalassotalea euphylliae]REL35979.1 electron transport complex subunit RsxG [Thalassotalea euphylliae]
MKIAITKNAKILALFAVACTAVVSLTFELTKNRIKQQEQKQLLSTLHAVVPDDIHDNDMSQRCVRINDPLLGSSDDQLAYLATQNDQPIAAAITSVAPDGYSGKIFLIVAMRVDGKLSAVRVLKHQETPGLGDKVEERKSDWIFSFNNRSKEELESSRWAVEKDGGMIDQFTGATITPRAVVKAVKKTANYFEQHKDTLFQQANACEVEQ